MRWLSVILLNKFDQLSKIKKCISVFYQMLRRLTQRCQTLITDSRQIEFNLLHMWLWDPRLLHMFPQLSNRLYDLSRRGEVGLHHVPTLVQNLRFVVFQNNWSVKLGKKIHERKGRVNFYLLWIWVASELGKTLSCDLLAVGVIVFDDLFILLFQVWDGHDLMQEWTHEDRALGLIWVVRAICFHSDGGGDVAVRLKIWLSLLEDLLVGSWGVLFLVLLRFTLKIVLLDEFSKFVSKIWWNFSVSFLCYLIELQYQVFKLLIRVLIIIVLNQEVHA